MLTRCLGRGELGREALSDGEGLCCSVFFFFQSWEILQRKPLCWAEQFVLCVRVKLCEGRDRSVPSCAPSMRAAESC